MKEGVKALARKKEIRYVLLHTHFCEPETRNRMEKLLVRFLGRPEVFRQGEMRILVFRLY